MQLWIVEHFFHRKKVPECSTGTFFAMKKVFNYSELHFSEVISYNIHTLSMLLEILNFTNLWGKTFQTAM